MAATHRVLVTIYTGNGPERVVNAGEGSKAWATARAKAIDRAVGYGGPNKHLNDKPPVVEIGTSVQGPNETVSVGWSKVPQGVAWKKLIARKNEGGRASSRAPRSSGAPRSRRASASDDEDFSDKPASAFAVVLDFSTSPVGQTNVQLGNFKTLDEAKAHSARVGGALGDAARAGGWFGGNGQVRMMAAHEGSHRVETIKVDASKATVWLKAHGGAKTKSSKPKSERASKPAKAPRASASPKAARRPAAAPAGAVGFFTWLEAREPGKETARKLLEQFSTEAKAAKAAAAKLKAYAQHEGRVPRKGRKIRLVVRDERGKLIAETNWMAA